MRRTLARALANLARSGPLERPAVAEPDRPPFDEAEIARC
jgi:hypothetical protein